MAVGEFLLVGALVKLLTSPVPVRERVPGWLLWVTILALVGTGAVWYLAYVRRRYDAWASAVDASGVFLVALCVGAAAGGGLLVVRAALRALSGSRSLPGTLVHAAAGFACLLAGVLLAGWSAAGGPGAVAVDRLLLGALGLLGITLLLHLLATRLVRDDQALAHKWALTKAVDVLVGGVDEPRVAEVVLTGAVELARGPARAAVALGPADRLEVTAATDDAGPVVGAVLRLDDGRVRSAGQERHGRPRAGAVAVLLDQGSTTALALPISFRDTTHGLLLFDTGERVGPSLRDALEWLCSAAGMSLAMAALTAELTDLAFHDSLTRLPNRVLLSEQTDVALARAARMGAMVALLVLDLDGFKRVNDGFGHRAGDEALVTVAARLRDQVRDADVVTRLGGDEFAVLLTDLREGDEAVAAARRIIDTLGRPVDVSGAQVRVGVSIGIVTWRPPADLRTARTAGGRPCRAWTTCSTTRTRRCTRPRTEAAAMSSSPKPHRHRRRGRRPVDQHLLAFTGS